jgi:uncharacterized membrane protein
MLVALPGLVAASIAWGWTSWPRATVVAVALAAVIGLPTTVADAFNAQDIETREMGARFRLSMGLNQAEQDALLWLQLATPADAVVQVDVNARHADTWTLIPTFAQRRMYAGLPISLLDEPEYHRRTAAVVAAYRAGDAAEAHRIFRAGHVDYVYVGDAERRVHPPEALAKFDRAPDFFTRVFENRAVTIYAVR